MCLIFHIEFEFFDKRVWHWFLWVLIIHGTEHEPYASDEIGDNDGNDDKSEDFINIQHHVLGYNFFIS